MAGVTGIVSTAAQDAIVAAIGAVFAQIEALESATTAITSLVMPPTNDSASGMAVMQDTANTAQFTAMFKLGLTEIAKAGALVTAENHAIQANDVASAATTNAISAPQGLASTGSAASGGAQIAQLAPLLNSGTGMFSQAANSAGQAASTAARAVPALTDMAANLPAPELPSAPTLPGGIPLVAPAVGVMGATPVVTGVQVQAATAALPDVAAATDVVEGAAAQLHAVAVDPVQQQAVADGEQWATNQISVQGPQVQQNVQTLSERLAEVVEEHPVAVPTAHSA